MKIALLGGTGDIGEGLALRWAYHTDHEVIVGSREADRAANKAEEYETELDSRGVEVTVEGYENEEAARRADVVVAAVPPYHLSDTVEAVADALEGSVLVSPAVGMKRDEEGMHYHQPGAGSVTAVAAEAAPEDVPVVGAYHSLSAPRLANLDAELDMHTPIVGDDPDAKETVSALTEAIEGLDPIDAGPLSNATEVESLTPLLLNLAEYNDGLKHAGVRFH